MCKFKLFGLVAGQMMFGIAIAAAAPAFPAGVEAREARLIAKLKPQSYAWIKQEAGRETASNTASEATALQAVRSVGPALNLAGMSVEEAAMLIMMSVARDADKDLRQILADVQRANAQKQALRQAVEKQKAAQASMKNQIRQEYSAQQGSPRIARSAALDRYLASQRINADSLGDLSQEQQLKMQMLMDRMTKAEEAASHMAQKFSETADAITGNMK